MNEFVKNWYFEVTVPAYCWKMTRAETRLEPAEYDEAYGYETTLTLSLFEVHDIIEDHEFDGVVIPTIDSLWWHDATDEELLKMIDFIEENYDEIYDYIYKLYEDDPVELNECPDYY